MSDFSVRSENVDVEQIMRQIRARIREKRGVDYTEDEIRELANVKLEKFIDPKGVRSGLLEEYRRVSTPEPPTPNFAFGEDTLYETHRGPIRWLRALFRPFLKLLFNPNPLIQALHIQAELNTRNAERTARRAQLDALHYEVIHNLVVELTRTGVEVKSLKMRLESMASRLDFDERRARALEGVVQYRAGAATPLQPPTGQDQGRRDQSRREQGQREQGQRNQGSRDQRPRDQRPRGPQSPVPPSTGPSSQAPRSSVPQSQVPQSAAPGPQGAGSEGSETQAPRDQGLETQGPATQGPATKGLATQGPATKGLATKGQRDEGPDATYYFLLGRYLEGAGKIDEAVAALRKAIALEPASAEPRAELAGLYARQEKSAEALTAAEDALTVDPKNEEANRVLGSVLAALAEQRQAGRPGDDVASYPKRAMAALEIARGDGAGDLSIDLTLARLYLDADRPADAIPLLRRIVLEQPQYAEGSVLLADAQESAGAPDAAVETLTNLLDDQPQFFRGRVQLAELYEHQRRWPQAADAWAKVHALNARNTEVAARRASALVNAGRPGDARDILTAALKIAPGDLRMTFMLAQAQRDAGDLDGAELTARALQTSHPEDVRATYLLGQILDARGRHQEIVDLLKPQIARQKAAKAKGGSIAMLLGSEGLALQQLRRYDEAVAVFKEAIDLAPQEPVRYVLLIQGYSAAGRHKDALDAAERARATFPHDTTVLYQLGAALDRAGRPAEAEKMFRDVIARDPLDAGALNYIGYMLAERGTSLDEAVTLIQRALTIEPGNPSFLDSLGWTYVQQGRLDLADTPLSTAAEKLPKNSVIQDHLGDLRQKQNRHADAIAAWQKALAGDGDSLDRVKVQKKIDTARKLK